PCSIPHRWSKTRREEKLQKTLTSHQIRRTTGPISRAREKPLITDNRKRSLSLSLSFPAIFDAIAGFNCSIKLRTSPCSSFEEEEYG
ncbi:hypothetical protein POUND7_016613, partial [Theobroma cacao]